MRPRPWSRALAPLLPRLHRAATAPSERPTEAQDATRSPGLPWDLRTLILVFPADAPFRFLNLNLSLGLTGTPFDQPERWRGRPARDAFDLQLCLEGRGEALTYKRYHSIAAELRQGPGRVALALGDRVRLEGGWPDYRLRYHQPEADLELNARLTARPGLHWWADLGDRYGHYTSFADCELSWRWGPRSGRHEQLALWDHGWGRTLLPLRVPLRVFRYEVLRLPDGGVLASLWTEGPGRLELECAGAWRPAVAARSQRIERYRCEVHQADRFANRAGATRRVPRRWTGSLTAPGGSFSYEAVRRTEPRPVLGDGFLYAFDYQGHGRGDGVPTGTVAGEGYVEQLGTAWAARCRRRARRLGE